MTKLVHVQYLVPVSVVVDVTEEAVKEVWIWDQDLEETPTVFNEAHTERILDGSQFIARAVCRERVWPTWTFAPQPQWLTRGTPQQTGANNEPARRGREPSRS